MSDPLRELGSTVGSVADELGDAAVLGDVRRRLLEAPSPRTRSRRGWATAALATAAVAALVLVLGVVFSRQPAALTFEVGSPSETGAVGTWLAATDAPLPVRFSEGTRLELHHGARLRVTEVTPHGARVLLEKGALEAEVAKVSGHAAWAFQAGPFTVDVTGTAFTTSWDPGAEVFHLQMQEGTVVVTGPLLERREMRGGEHLVVDVQAKRVQIARASSPPLPAACAGTTPSPAPPAPAASPTASATEPAPAPVRSGAPAATASGAPTEGWQRHLAAGRHADAMRALDDGTFAGVVANGSSGQVSALAEAARFGGRADRARQALLALRTRFGARGANTFLLGKVAADQLGAGGEALTWFAAYLQESPNGPLAEQALGRILGAQKPGTAEAIRLAEQYLSRYPSGAYAPLARRLKSAAP